MSKKASWKMFSTSRASKHKQAVHGKRKRRNKILKKEKALREKKKRENIVRNLKFLKYK